MAGLPSRHFIPEPRLVLPRAIKNRRGSRVRVGAEGVVPAADVGGQLVGLARAPRAGLVLVDGRYVAEHRVYHAPRCLDRVLAREERRVALPRGAEQIG